LGRSVYIVDAFTDGPFAGNPAGVVTRADGLSDAQMQAVALELRQTETCFVMQGTEVGVDYHLRRFTPTVEVDLCGHATVAAYTCLAAEGRVLFGAEPVHLRHTTRRGVLSVWVEGNHREARNVSQGLPRCGGRRTTQPRSPTPWGWTPRAWSRNFLWRLKRPANASSCRSAG
jgi:PhzF family phenazine biosynthesis protein